MDIVDLPSVDGGVRIVDALRLAQTKNRSGLIVRPFEQPRVLTVAELSFFMEERNKRHERANIEIQYVIPRRRAVHAANLHTANEFRVSSTARNDLQLVLDTAHADFAVLDTTPGMGEVVTIAESIAGRLRLGFSICVCTADPTHVYTSGALIVPGFCNIDGKPVVCS